MHAGPLSPPRFLYCTAARATARGAKPSKTAVIRRPKKRRAPCSAKIVGVQRTRLRKRAGRAHAHTLSAARAVCASRVVTQLLALGLVAILCATAAARTALLLALLLLLDNLRREQRLERLVLDALL